MSSSTTCRTIERQEAYASDVTYGTNNEFGFDYLRDNMKFDLMRRWCSAKSPLRRSSTRSTRFSSTRRGHRSSSRALRRSRPTSTTASIASSRTWNGAKRSKRKTEPSTPPATFLVDEKAHTVTLTEEGVEAVEASRRRQPLRPREHGPHPRRQSGACGPGSLFKRDVDYLIKDGKVVIVDEFTGRMMPGRRWSDGLHQAVEAKEGVRIERENQTLATITFQNYFRMYQKLSGMTGTAETEAGEFAEIYDLDVTVIPTNRPMVRDDRCRSHL